MLDLTRRPLPPVLRLIPVLPPKAVTDTLRRDRTFLRLPRPARLLPFPKGMMPVRALDALGRRLFSLYL